MSPAAVEGYHDGVDKVSVRSDVVDRALRQRDTELRLEDESDFQQVERVRGEIIHERYLGHYLFDIDAKLIVFGRTDPKLIDDSSLNYVGLDDTDPNAKDDSVVPTLAIPVNRPVELILMSKDVTHSFWVPQLRFKQDLVPGMAIHVHFTATKTGKYELACAELCGMNHYKMKSYMLVLPENEFNELVAMPQAKFQARKDELLNKYQLPQY